MRIPINLLSTSLRKEWVQVPAHPYAREYGTASVRLQEIAGDLFDDLWAACIATEREVEQLSEATPRDAAKLHKAKQAKRAAHAAVIDACVCDHDAADFQVEIPREAPTSSLGAELLAMLDKLGFSKSESLDALSTGLARKPFAAGHMAPFYARCQPDSRFLLTLLRFIRRFQGCDNPTPDSYWVANGLDPLAAAKDPTT